jgi:hypothetical protein
MQKHVQGYGWTGFKIFMILYKKILTIEIDLLRCFDISTASVQPKPGFGSGNQNQGPILVSVSEPKLFFAKLKLFFSKIFQIICFLGEISF